MSFYLAKINASCAEQPLQSQQDNGRDCSLYLPPAVGNGALGTALSEGLEHAVHRICLKEGREEEERFHQLQLMRLQLY